MAQDENSVFFTQHRRDINDDYARAYAHGRSDERDRCAKIADEYTWDMAADARQIAGRIRGGEVESPEL